MHSKIRSFFSNILHLGESPSTSKVILDMGKEINELGGLRFIIDIEKGGWTAECKNLSGIITGGIGVPSSLGEIDSNIKDAIFSAFSIPSHLCDEKLIKGPLDLEEVVSLEQLSIVYNMGNLRPSL